MLFKFSEKAFVNGYQNTRTLFFPPTLITPHAQCFTWQQAVQQ